MEFLNLVLGESTYSEWLFAALLVLLGFILLKLVDYETRREKNTVFNFGYWWKDNRVEFFIGSILFYVLFRFYADWSDIILNNDFVSVPEFVFKNKYLSVFMLGFFMQIVLYKLRSVLRFRYKQYPSGQARAEHVGNRPDDR